MRRLLPVVLSLLFVGGCSAQLRQARTDIKRLETDKHELCGYLVEAHQNLNGHMVVYLGDELFFDGIALKVIYMPDLDEQCDEHLENVREMQEGLRQLVQDFVAQEGK